MMTVGSLFAGIGGFDLGFQRAGFEIKWQVEIDGYCQKVLAKNFPRAQRFGDIRQASATTLAPVDVICGGFPCQDISNAGKGAGIEGERSGLWSEQHRIISELRPRFVVVENVAALLGRGMSRVLGDLSEIGYDAEWEVISAFDMDAPHRRERVWIVAYPDRRGPEGQGKTNGIDRQRVSEREVAGCYGQGRHVADAEGQPEWARLRGDESGGQRRGRFGNGRGAPTDVADSIGEGLEGHAGYGEDWGRRSEQYGSVSPAHVFRGECPARKWPTEPELGRVAHGISNRVDRLKGLGNAIVPQIAEMIARRILEVA